MFYKNSISLISVILFLTFSTISFAIEFRGKFIQGHFIIGITKPNTKILIDKKYRGKSYATKALKLASKYFLDLNPFFNTLSMEKVFFITCQSSDHVILTV